MKQIIITITLIIATIAVAATTMLTGSVQAAGALVLLYVAAGIWWVKVEAWPMARSLFVDIRRWYVGD